MAVLHPHPPFGDLTYYPTSRRIRGTRGKDTIVDSWRAVLVWEPGKKVPIYAFPREDVALVSGPAAPSASQARGFADPDLDGYTTIPWDSLDHWFEENDAERLTCPVRGNMSTSSRCGGQVRESTGWLPTWSR